MSKSNLYRVISPVTNKSIEIAPHLSVAIEIAENKSCTRIESDNGDIWQCQMTLNKDNIMIPCWFNLSLDPLSDKLKKWLDDQYIKLQESEDLECKTI